MSTTIVTRTGKGSALTIVEMDANFTNLKTTSDAAQTAAQVQSAINTYGSTVTSELVSKADLDPITHVVPSAQLAGIPVDGNWFVLDSSGRLSMNTDGLTEFINTIIGSSSGKVPATAPTTFVTNDTNDTADFTFSADGTAIGDYEYQINGGTITTATVKPIPAGNISIPTGFFKIRVAATDTKLASDWLSNTTPFTVASSSPGSFIDMTSPFAKDDVIIVSGNNYSLNTADTAGGTVSVEKVPAGGSATIRFSANPAKSSGVGGVGVGQGIEGKSSLIAGLQFGFASTGSGRFQGLAGGQGQDDYTNKSFTGTPLGQIVLNGSTIQLQYSFDGGATWTQIDSTITITQPNSDLYFKTIFDTENTENDNVIQEGMV